MKKKPSTQKNTSLAAAKIEAMRASQVFRNSQLSTMRPNASMNTSMKRAKKRGDR